MRTGEMAVLAMITIGTLSVDDQGRIWRHREVTRGSAIGGREVACDPRRADTGRSKKDGYRRVQVTIGTQRYAAQAHRIVWMVANQRTIPPTIEINHEDGVKDHNWPSNLTLKTRSGNVIHALHELGHYQQRSAQGKLTPEQVIQIRSLRDRMVMSRVQVAELFSISTVMVRNIETRRNWKWIPEVADNNIATMGR